MRRLHSPSSPPLRRLWARRAPSALWARRDPVRGSTRATVDKDPDPQRDLGLGHRRLRVRVRFKDGGGLERLRPPRGQRTRETNIYHKRESVAYSNARYGLHRVICSPSRHDLDLFAVSDPHLVHHVEVLRGCKSAHTQTRRDHGRTDSTPLDSRP
ncbi:MAG: hypothetical protein [Cressdnaviricota sp.]|nr:MAG: hypothetical protein [Cressdnaviricota sp.]